MLFVEDVSVAIGQECILRHVTLQVAPGALMALMGRNGSGKSSFASAVAGHPRYIVSSGKIYFNQESITSLPAYERVKRGMWYVPQHIPQFKGIPLQEFLIDVYRVARQTPGAKTDALEVINEHIRAAMDMLGISTAFLSRGLHEGLSGGERKKIELLQLLLVCPQLIILDEVDSGLDSVGVNALVTAIHTLRKKNPLTSVIIITHYQHLLDALSITACAVVEDGTIRQHVYQKNNHGDK